MDSINHTPERYFVPEPTEEERKIAEARRKNSVEQQERDAKLARELYQTSDPPDGRTSDYRGIDSRKRQRKNVVEMPKPRPKTKVA